MDKFAFYAAYHNGKVAAQLVRHVELVKTSEEGVDINGSFLEKLSEDDWEKLSGSMEDIWNKVKETGSGAWDKFKQMYTENPNLRKALWGVGGGLAGYGIDRMLGGKGWFGGALGAGAGWGLAPDKVPDWLKPGAKAAPGGPGVPATPDMMKYGPPAGQAAAPATPPDIAAQESALAAKARALVGQKNTPMAAATTPSLIAPTAPQISAGKIPGVVSMVPEAPPSKSPALIAGTKGVRQAEEARAKKLSEYQRDMRDTHGENWDKPPAGLGDFLKPADLSWLKQATGAGGRLLMGPGQGPTSYTPGKGVNSMFNVNQ